MTREEAEKYINEFPSGHVYAIGSIHHGYARNGMDELLLARINENKTLDFLEWLFENHVAISESEAWKEFMIQQLEKTEINKL